MHHVAAQLTLAQLKGLRRLLSRGQAALGGVGKPADAAVEGHKHTEILHTGHHAVAAPSYHRILQSGTSWPLNLNTGI